MIVERSSILMKHIYLFEIRKQLVAKSHRAQRHSQYISLISDRC
jgi:hypothetical protein